MKTVKAICTRDYEIELSHKDNGKYVIFYTISGISVLSEEYDLFEMATVLFDVKLQQLQDAVPTRYVS